MDNFHQTILNDIRKLRNKIDQLGTPVVLALSSSVDNIERRVRLDKSGKSVSIDTDDDKTPEQRLKANFIGATRATGSAGKTQAKFAGSFHPGQNA